MRILDRKLLRNLRELRGQAVAIVLIIACGVAAFLTVVIAYRGLKGSLGAYYREYRMADVFAPVKRAPRSLARELEGVPGVRRVQARIVFDVTLDVPGVDQPCSGRVISVPDRRQATLCDLHLTRGHWFEGDGTREVIVANRFAETHRLGVGDRIAVLMNNRKESLRIVGIATSPEFIYLIRGAGDILPDPYHFTVLWMSESFTEAVFDFEDAANDFLATIERDARPADVVAAFDHRLDRYGAVGAFARKDQASHRYVSDEIQGLEGSATLTPTIFLGVAAFVLHMLMGRLVRTQRTQIAVLRAFGHGTPAIAAHYLKLAVGIGAGGAAVGTVVGIWFARELLEIYRAFYDFPLLRFDVDPRLVALGFLISAGFASLGAFGAVRHAIRLAPAEAMRPEAPRVYRRVLAERISFLWSRLGFASRMILRNVARTKVRSAITVGGLALSGSIVMVAFFGTDSVDELLDFQFRLSERQDIRVAFHEERGRAALHELRRLDGVRRAEPELAVAVRLVHGWRERRAAITGLEPGHALHALLDRKRRTVPLPREGLLLSRKLAELLGADVGDELEVHVLTGKKQRFTMPIENVVDEYLGAFAYADLHRLARRIDEEAILSGALLSVDPRRAAALGRTLKDLPAVASVSFKERTIRNFNDTIAETQAIMMSVLVLFAGTITFGVVYNAARISLAERQRELGSMRVLGFTDREVGAVLVGENLLLAAVSLPFGVGLGSFFGWLMSRLYDTDLYRFPFVVRGDTVLWTVAAVLGFAVLANLALLRRIRRLDIVEVLKARE